MTLLSNSIDAVHESMIYAVVYVSIAQNKIIACSTK
jgi:hypothetical protein